MLRRVLIAAFALAIPAVVRSAATHDVIIDQDGGIDDLVAISLLLRSRDVHVRAITICPADSYLEPATRATQLFVDRLGGRNITIAKGHSEGTNPFPARWRKDAGRVLGIAALAGAAPSTSNPIVADDAAHYLAKLLSGDRLYTILETGPLTNIADALAVDPSIKKHIRRIYAMGGAVRVTGNVDVPGHDRSAEWNIFNQPQAAADVVQSGIPLTLIPLDATNKVPLSLAFLDRLAAQASVPSQLAAQSWRLAQQGVDQYYFWDTLTAAALLDPSVIRTEQLKIRVITTGTSQGRTVEDPRGSPIEVALDASREKVEQMFLNLLGK
jgi:inosine-uridine nucleoside N-ribohydrolase